jgi:hypothetical protein
MGILPNILYRWLTLCMIILPQFLLHALQYLALTEAPRLELSPESLFNNGNVKLCLQLSKPK